jgi:hypothetical protein
MEIEIIKPLKYNKVYYKKFIEKNKDKIHEKITCEVCSGKYTYFNKSRHLKSKKHRENQ